MKRLKFYHEGDSQGLAKKLSREAECRKSSVEGLAWKQDQRSYAHECLTVQLFKRA
jgi:hypothetical protein